MPVYMYIYSYTYIYIHIFACGTDVPKIKTMDTGRSSSSLMIASVPAEIVTPKNTLKTWR